MGSRMPFMSMDNPGAGDMCMMYQRTMGGGMGMMGGFNSMMGMGMGGMGHFGMGGMGGVGRARPGMNQDPGPARVTNRGQHGFHPYA